MTNPLSEVKSWLYHIGGLSDDALEEIGAHAADMVVVDQADTDLVSFSAAQVNTMRGAGAKKVISYLSIGEAETYRAYWDSTWEQTPPPWIGEENPEWEGNIKVAYWDPAWQEIVFEMVDTIVDAGFDGLYLDIIDAYYYWEATAPHGDQDHYRELMIDFVAAINARAQARLLGNGDNDTEFAIIGQNGEDLAEYPEYLEIIDGIGKEDLYFYYPNGAADSFGPTPEGWLTGSQDLLETAHQAGVEVFVVEYVPTNEVAEATELLQAELDYLAGLDAPLYLTNTRALDDIDISFTPDGVNVQDVPALAPQEAMTDVANQIIRRLEGTTDSTQTAEAFEFIPASDVFQDLHIDDVRMNAASNALQVGNQYAIQADVTTARPALVEMVLDDGADSFWF